MGKKFDPSMKLVRRYYPHTTNMDGFFVSKFQKIGPSPTGGAKEKVEMDIDENVHQPISTSDDEEEEEEEVVVDGQKKQKKKKKADGFGGFDENEDKDYMERAKKNAMRRRGFNPRADGKSAPKAA